MYVRKFLKLFNLLFLIFVELGTSYEFEKIDYFNLKNWFRYRDETGEGYSNLF